MKNDDSLMIGLKYNKLKVISITRVNGLKKALCDCDCGNTVMCSPSDLKRNHTKSCGCQRVSSCIERSTKHGMSRHPLTPIYSAMIQRCENPKNERYADYGGRGIFVCEDWENDINSFFKWAIDNGWRKGLDIDRRDNNKGYSPDNCRIVDRIVNQRNKRSNKMISYNGETKSLAEWCDVLGISYSRTITRLNREKLTPKEAFEKPNRYQHITK